MEIIDPDRDGIGKDLTELYCDPFIDGKGNWRFSAEEERIIIEKNSTTQNYEQLGMNMNLNLIGNVAQKNKELL